MAAQLISVLSQNDEEKEKLRKDIESFNYQVHVFDKIETIIYLFSIRWRNKFIE